MLEYRDEWAYWEPWESWYLKQKVIAILRLVLQSKKFLTGAINGR